MKFLKLKLKNILQKIGDNLIHQIEHASSAQQLAFLVKMGLQLEVVALKLGIELE